MTNDSPVSPAPLHNTVLSPETSPPESRSSSKATARMASISAPTPDALIPGTPIPDRADAEAAVRLLIR